MSAQSDDTRKALRRLLRVLARLRGLHPRMEISQAAVLLEVLCEPGVKATDLSKRVGLKSSALSRAVSIFGNRPYRTGTEWAPDEGLDLITQDRSLDDRRAYDLAPTRRGWTLAEDLATILKE